MYLRSRLCIFVLCMYIYSSALGFDFMQRRRDRINERMKALQELIPHSNKVYEPISMIINVQN